MGKRKRPADRKIILKDLGGLPADTRSFITSIEREIEKEEKVIEKEQKEEAIREDKINQWHQFQLSSPSFVSTVDPGEVGETCKALLEPALKIILEEFVIIPKRFSEPKHPHVF